MNELQNLETLKWVVFRTFERSVSVTSFDVRNSNYKSAITLGAGLREIAVITQFLSNGRQR